MTGEFQFFSCASALIIESHQPNHNIYMIKLNCLTFSVMTDRKIKPKKQKAKNDSFTALVTKVR